MKNCNITLSVLHWPRARGHPAHVRGRHGCAALPHRPLLHPQELDQEPNAVFIVKPSPPRTHTNVSFPSRPPHPPPPTPRSYELVGTFLHLPGGLVTTTIRFSVSYFDMALAFGRLDVPISSGQPALDPGHSAYMAAVLCDIKFNSPFIRWDV